MRKYIPKLPKLTILAARAKELRKKEKGELLKDLDNFRNELAQLRVAQVTGGTPAKLAKMYGLLSSFCSGKEGICESCCMASSCVFIFVPSRTRDFSLLFPSIVFSRLLGTFLYLIGFALLTSRGSAFSSVSHCRFVESGIFPP